MIVTTRIRYDAVAMSLHWLIAVLLIFMLFLGEDLMDEKGGKSMVTIADVRQSNGVIHVIDTVLLPK